MRLFLIIISLMQLSCADQGKEQSWWQKTQTDWPQLVLTNHIHFKYRKPVKGASSFVLTHDRDTVVCTARHVIEEPIGVVPPVPQDSVNTLLKLWHAAPRNSDNFDSIHIKSLRNTKPSKLDFLVLDAEIHTSSITPLSPAFSTTSVGDTAYVIGCQRNEKRHSQQVFETTVSYASETEIILKSKSAFEPLGFSGAPVINQKGKAIGILYGANISKEGLFLYLIPINQTFPFIKPHFRVVE